MEMVLSLNSKFILQYQKLNLTASGVQMEMILSLTTTFILRHQKFYLTMSSV